MCPRSIVWKPCIGEVSPLTATNLPPPPAPADHHADDGGADDDRADDVAEAMAGCMWNLKAYVCLRLYILLISEKCVLGPCVLLDVYVHSHFGWWLIDTSCNNPFQPFRPKIRTESFFAISASNRCALHACANLKLSATTIRFHIFPLSKDFLPCLWWRPCCFCLSAIPTFPSTCLHNIFQQRPNKWTQGVVKPLHIVQSQELHWLLAPTPGNWVSNRQLKRVNCFLLQKKGEQRVQFGESSTNARNISYARLQV